MNHNKNNSSGISRRKWLASAGIFGTLLTDQTAFADSRPKQRVTGGATHFINVKDHGVIGDGMADDTSALRKIFEELQPGSTVFFPAGNYKISRSISVNTNHISITGQSLLSSIIYSYEQTDVDTPASASLFSFRDGIRNVQLTTLSLSYTGHFFPKFGESYHGKVNGFLFKQCEDIYVEHVDISGFNANAIQITTGNPDAYARRVRINSCNLHHNRVAGVLFGNVDYITISNCDLDHQGSALDGGTGYGCAGASSEIPRYIQIVHNRASYNMRKGLDLHAGLEAIIEGNLCHANRLYGIYAEGRRTGNVMIKNNIISGMRRDTIGIPEPYTWITGIDFGPYAGELVEDDYHNYVIEGNLITDFGIDVQGSAFPIRCYFNFKRGSVHIKNNTIRGSRTSNLIGFATRVRDQPRQVMIDISGNHALVEKVTHTPIELGSCTQVNFSHNQFMLSQGIEHGFINLHPQLLDSMVFMGNQINVPGTSAESLFNPMMKDGLNGKAVITGNVLNGSVW